MTEWVNIALTVLRFHATRWWLHYVALFGALLIIASATCYACVRPPSDFPVGTTITIAPGLSTGAVAKLLVEQHVIKSADALRILVRLQGGTRGVNSGPYLFAKPEDAITISKRLIAGDYGIPPIKVTFPEGMTVREMAAKVGELLPLVNTNDFLREAKGSEGYLFPDTYFFSPSEDAKALVSTLKANFETKLASIGDEIAASGHSKSDLVTIASLIEAEAKTPEDRRIVSGILWKRLSIGMALQVDAVFGYILGKDAYAPTLDDLKIDSPYNTYTHTGIPPTPINNPGLDAIVAAATPTKTSYLYYLTGTDGKMHYASSFEGHQVNREKYLK